MKARTKQMWATEYLHEKITMTFIATYEDYESVIHFSIGDSYFFDKTRSGEPRLLLKHEIKITSTAARTGK